MVIVADGCGPGGTGQGPGRIYRDSRVLDSRAADLQCRPAMGACGTGAAVVTAANRGSARPVVQKATGIRIV